MKHLYDIKYDWINSIFYKGKKMSKWADDYIKNNYIDVVLLKQEFQELIKQDDLIYYNRYGDSFEIILSTDTNELINSLCKASKCK